LCKLHVLYKNATNTTGVRKSEMYEVAYGFMKFMSCLTSRQLMFFIYKIIPVIACMHR